MVKFFSPKQLLKCVHQTRRPAGTQFDSEKQQQPPWDHVCDVVSSIIPEANLISFANQVDKMIDNREWDNEATYDPRRMKISNHTSCNLCSSLVSILSEKDDIGGWWWLTMIVMAMMTMRMVIIKTTFIIKMIMMMTIACHRHVAWSLHLSWRKWAVFSPAQSRSVYWYRCQ